MSRLIQCYFVIICELYKQFLSESCFYTIFFQCINKPCALYMDSHPSFLSKTFTDLLNITETNAQLYCCWERESEWHVMSQQTHFFTATRVLFPPRVGRLTHTQHAREDTNMHMHRLTRRRRHLTPDLREENWCQRWEAFSKQHNGDNFGEPLKQWITGYENRMSSSKRASQICR